MMPQKHTPLQSFPFDIRTVEKRCSYVNTISINLALIKQKRNSDIANILDMYVKNRHLFANSAPWAGNVSNDEKSGNFPPAPRKPAPPAFCHFVWYPDGFCGVHHCNMCTRRAGPTCPAVCFYLRDIPRLGAGHFWPQSQKRPKGLLDTCGFKTSAAPRTSCHTALVPRERRRVQTSLNVELICSYPRCR